MFGSHFDRDRGLRQVGCKSSQIFGFGHFPFPNDQYDRLGVTERPVCVPGGAGDCGRWPSRITPPLAKIAQKRHRAVAALEIAALEILGLAGLEVGQRVDTVAPTRLFPSAGPESRRSTGSHQRRSDQARLVRRENDLRIFRVRGWIVEAAKDFAHERGMETPLQFVDLNESAVIEGLQDWHCDTEHSPRPVGFFLKRQPGISEVLMCLT